MDKQITLSIPADQLKDQICKCGNTMWMLAQNLKIVPPLYSQSGRYEHLMIQSGFLCTNCGTLIPLRPVVDAKKVITLSGKEN
jgi:cell division FtsZ-interacting protein ZapD